ncbi:hypothetical protein ANN_15461 [Periplaneta americana]|uniref:Uncharacterized protein n=1 Tax=Periplaneta americana TaxID=6978 RepID=A0ABQ8SH50_PERAM|nr:hypothetical protein ANN_15461 [Periplaneta americana]
MPLSEENNRYLRFYNGQKYNACSSALCNFLHSPVTSSLLDPNIFLRTLFSNTLNHRFSLKFHNPTEQPVNIVKPKPCKESINTAYTQKCSAPTICCTTRECTENTLYLQSVAIVENTLKIHSWSLFYYQKSNKFIGTTCIDHDIKCLIIVYTLFFHFRSKFLFRFLKA